MRNLVRIGLCGYGRLVKLDCRLIPLCWALILVVGMVHSGAAPETKTIRLRNEIINTGSTPKYQAVTPGLDKPVAGLFLIQFTGPIQPAWREELQKLNVSLLRSVPDD